MSSSLTRCLGCGALVAETDGPTHAYIGASAGCWAVYGEVLAREYSDPSLADIHRLTVDAYAVQHPGVPSRRSIQSVGLHLVSLYLVVACGSAPAWATRRLQTLAKAQVPVRWLAPPADPGAVTVVDVAGARDATEHSALVRRWARCVWEAWSAHHETVRHWAETHAR